MRRLAGLVALAATLVPLAAGAETVDRLAVEMLEGEDFLAASLAFETACQHAGAMITGVRPVHFFDHDGGHFLRFEVEGSGPITQCLTELEPPRRGVDGTIRWFDGFRGALVVPAKTPEVRLPDAAWFDESPEAIAPPPDSGLLKRLEAGDLAAVAALSQREAPIAWATVLALPVPPGPKALALLERIAKESAYPAVRKAAVERLDPKLSFAALLERVRADESAVVRMTALRALGVVGSLSGLPGLPEDPGAEAAIIDRVSQDPAWDVRRAAAWQLTSAAVARHAQELARRVFEDPEPRTAGAILEVLAGANLVDRALLDRALQSPWLPVRIVATALLAQQFEPRDLPRLWEAMQAPERGLRLAAIDALPHVTSRDAGPVVYAMFLAEADELDADAAYLRKVTEYLAAHPFDALPLVVRRRLSEPRSPIERRLLSGLYARVSPAEATSMLSPMLDSADVLERAIAAEWLPSTPAVAARRLKLLTDPDPELRAAAVLGICWYEPAAAAAARAAEIFPIGLGQEASLARQGCTGPRTARTRDTTDRPSGEGRWPALAAMLIVLVTVLISKLGGATPPSEPPVAT